MTLLDLQRAPKNSYFLGPSRKQLFPGLPPDNICCRVTSRQHLLPGYPSEATHESFPGRRSSSERCLPRDSDTPLGSPEDVTSCPRLDSASDDRKIDNVKVSMSPKHPVLGCVKNRYPLRMRVSLFRGSDNWGFFRDRAPKKVKKGQNGRFWGF